MTVDFTIKGLDRDKARELGVWLELSLFQTIRDDADIDNIAWLKYWIDVIEKLNEIAWNDKMPTKTERMRYVGYDKNRDIQGG